MSSVRNSDGWLFQNGDGPGRLQCSIPPEGDRVLNGKPTNTWKHFHTLTPLIKLHIAERFNDAYVPNSDLMLHHSCTLHLHICINIFTSFSIATFISFFFVFPRLSCHVGTGHIQNISLYRMTVSDAAHLIINNLNILFSRVGFR